MQILTIQQFNALGESAWLMDLETYHRKVPGGEDGPQLREYVYFKSYGYVAFDDCEYEWSLWAKTKKEAERKGKEREAIYRSSQNTTVHHNS